jgi:hypothetical protein
MSFRPPSLDYYAEAMSGSWSWAQYQLSRGRQVRRRDWPVFVSWDETLIWRVWPFRGETYFQGFASGVVGPDNGGVVGLGSDGGGYRPSDEDRSANDWQLLEAVTKEQLDQAAYSEPPWIRYSFKEEAPAKSVVKYHSHAVVLASISLALVAIFIVSHWFH